MLKAIFWDMDGTMVDSEPLWGVATYELSEALGRRLTPELRESTIGGSFPNTLSICALHAGISLSEEDYPRYRRRMFDRMAELFSGDLTPNPGVRELLTELKAQNLPMLVTTNTERELADNCIDAVGRDFFIGSVTGDEVPAPKPAPDMYLEAARRVGANPSDCLVFEDSFAGMSGAIAAGCRVIGLPEDPDSPVPEGVVLLRSLQGSNSFQGVTAEKVHEWFDRIPQ
ncbi:Phosphorylated carbohydrates phosphatase [Corynebacterium occultum]|uniref:Phosphorylated carbohydrates phosphatase n=1 Tax=Corynebacterium occultum TaxID=2675219 RepID=A0A6B8WBM9_9CORY|nr:HAD family phosphatase [Corynebacterium occultum]QGU07420.1 Phosphorylated carbohydrates phosphatase [Corynebacterium occultum]